MRAFWYSSDFGRGGSVETVPPEQVLKIEHRLPPANQVQVSPKSGWRHRPRGADTDPTGGTSHAGERVEIAAKCGHNLSSPRHFLIHDAHVRRFSTGSF